MLNYIDLGRKVEEFKFDNPSSQRTIFPDINIFMNGTISKFFKSTTDSNINSWYFSLISDTDFCNTYHETVVIRDIEFLDEEDGIQYL